MSELSFEQMFEESSFKRLRTGEAETRDMTVHFLQSKWLIF